LNFFKASKHSALVVRGLVALDALTIIELFLQKFGMGKFIEFVFWFGLLL
jgi:hypothetical protein